MKKYSKVKKRPNKRQWAVYSSKGKKLSRWYPSRKKAVERLRQIEYFKNNTSDHELGLTDVVDHNTYSDTLYVKPNDGQFTYKQAFGLTPSYVNAAPTHLEFDEEIANRFFSGDSRQDFDIPMSLPEIGEKYNDDLSEMKDTLENIKDDLEFLEDALYEEDEIKEAMNVRMIIKKALNLDDLLSGAKEFLNKDLGLSKFVQDIPPEELTDEGFGELFGTNLANPFSVNEELSRSKRSIGVVDYKTKESEKLYNNIKNSQEAMNILYQEVEGIFGGGGLDTDELKVFASFLYLMHNGYSCSSTVFVKTKDGKIVDTNKTIMKYIEKAYNNIASDWIIPGVILAGAVPEIIGALPDNFLGKISVLGLSILGGYLGPGGHIIENISWYKLCSLICKESDKSKYKFENGKIIYSSNNNFVIEDN